MSSFCDQTTVTFTAGKGGDGSVSFRREKHVPYGGPDGGDGGNGGNIVLQVNPNINTLTDFNARKQFQADDGGNGGKQNCSGKNGDNLILDVPAGTKITNPETGELLADLKEPGQTYIVAQGGRGGRGNINFKSSIHQAPKFAELGEKGEETTVTLELQLVADIGIIGFPSAGKSTLISVISNAKPKIADYPFTTLIPNLGVIDMQRFDKRLKKSFVAADIPGLIEGAHEGKGLGHEFLRHISRTATLVHLLDPTRQNPNDYKAINDELAAYDADLAKKKQIVAISKIDSVSEEQLQEYQQELYKIAPNLKKTTIHHISSVTNTGLKELVFKMWEEVENTRKEQAKVVVQESKKSSQQEKVVFKPHLKKKKFTVRFVRTKNEAAANKTRRIFDVTGDRIEQVVEMTDLNNEEGVVRIYHFLQKMGIKRELQKLGAKPGDKIRIAGKTFRMRT